MKSKQWVLLFCSVTFLSFGCKTEKSKPLTTATDKASYAVGYQIGERFKASPNPMNQEAFVAGFKDASQGSARKVSQEDAQTAFGELQKDAEAKSKLEGEESAKKGKEFLAKNKERKEVTTLPSGLQYEVLKKGDGKESPKAESLVTVHYRGTLLDGKEFDSSYSRNEPAKFQLNQVIPGWTEALQLMKAGDKWKLFIPSELAYQDRALPDIPANSTLIFEVELLEIGGS